MGDKKRRSLYKPFRKVNFHRYATALVDEIDRDMMIVIAYGNLDEDGVFHEWREDWNTPITQCSHVKLVDSGDAKTIVYAPQSVVDKRGIVIQWR